MESLQPILPLYWNILESLTYFKVSDPERLELAINITLITNLAFD
jgi:hypothetical protein